MSTLLKARSANPRDDDFSLQAGRAQFISASFDPGARFSVLPFKSSYRVSESLDGSGWTTCALGCCSTTRQ
ncbi:MAG: hypothetical protein ABIZ91_05530 [Gemmatimonadaceae bacterium]